MDKTVIILSQKSFKMTRVVVPSRTFRDNCKDKAISRKAAIELTSSVG